MKLLKPQDLVGQTVAGFELTDYLSSGATAWVFRAKSTVNEDIVRALKIVKPELIAEAEIRRRFAREARAFELIDHPSVVRFYGLRETEDFLIMEMEYLEGQTLEEVRQARKDLPVSQVVEWIAAAARGVGSAHDLGIVHRDLKPSNLFLTRSGEVKVLDFGLARLQETTSTFQGSKMAIGTARYMAPEVVVEGARKATPASDVYSLALSMYVLLAGRSPFRDDSGPSGADDQADMWAQVNRDAPPLRTLVPAAPKWLEEEMARALRKEPDQRHRTCGDLALALEQQGSTVAAPVYSPAPAAERPAAPPATASDRAWIQTPGLVIALVVAALLVGGATAAVIIGQMGGGNGEKVVEPAPGPVDPAAPGGKTAIARTCSDANATGEAKRAADAWHACRWGEAVELYEQAASTLSGADRACATERTDAYRSANSPNLQKAENRVLGRGKRKSCHLAKYYLGKVDDFSPSDRCRRSLDECEDQEWASLEREIAQSTRRLNRQLRSEFISEVSFSRIGKQWRWDINIEGQWSSLFRNLRKFMAIEDTESLIRYLGFLSGVVDTIGKESKTTSWSSRRLYLRDRGQCVGYMTTKKARLISTKLNRAMKTNDPNTTLNAVRMVLEMDAC